MITPRPAPSLDALAAEPCRVLELEPAEALELLARLAGLQTVLLSRVAVTGASGRPAVERGNGADRLLAVEEAAQILGVSKDHLYRCAGDYPFTIRLSERRLRFSAKGIQRYIFQNLRK